MTIVPGTSVRLPDGREGVVIPPPVWFRDRVLVKVKGGRKSWFKVDDCTPKLPVTIDKEAFPIVLNSLRYG